jgi:hypothetical protein
MTAPEIRRCIHIGLPKSGSTALQLCFFSKHPQISLIARASMGGNAPQQREIDKLINRINRCDDLLFDYEAEKALAAQLVRPYAADSRCVLLSVEGFTERRAAGFGIKSERLRQLFPGSRIVLVIRRPLDLLSALYHQFYTYSSRRTFEFSGRIYHAPSLDQWLRNGLEEPNHPISPIVTLNFNRLAQRYVRYFGRDNVQVMLFEDLRHDAPRFIGALATFLGLDPELSQQVFAANNRMVNTRSSAEDILRRGLAGDGLFRRIRSPRLQRLVLKAILRWMGGEGHFTHIAPDTRARIEAIAAPECAAVAAEWGLDIAGYDYPR